MGKPDVDYIEVKLLDSSFTTYYKGRSSVVKLDKINVVLESKVGLRLIKAKEIKSDMGWFD